MSSLLQAGGVSVALGGKDVVRGADLTVGAGEVLAIIGPNGAGKSSLLRALAGLHPVTDGQVVLAGEDIAVMAPEARAKHQSYLPQMAEVHWPLRVDHLVALGMQDYRDGQARVERALDAVDAGHLTERSAFQLSGGERARVLLARALAAEAPLLLADEPVAALDPAHQMMVMELFRGLAAQGKSTVVVLHDLLLAARYADRVCLMQGGEMVACGTPKEVLTSENLSDVYGIDVRSVEGEAGVLVPWARSTD